MAKWIKARYYMSAAGGVSLTAFYAYKEEIKHDPRTRQTIRYQSTKPKMTSIRICQSGQLHELSGVMLKPDEFMIQDIPENTVDGVAQEGKISPLKALLKSGRIMLEDYERECAILETQPVELYQEKAIDDEMVAIDITHSGTTPDRERKNRIAAENLAKAKKTISAEKQAKLDSLKTISSIKINKEAVIEALYEKGLETVEDVADSSVDILMSVKGIGRKVAENILQELNVVEEV